MRLSIPAAFLLAAIVSSKADAQGLTRSKTVAQSRAEPALANYVAPAVGTRFVYSNFSNTITRVAGWSTWFTDGNRRPGMTRGLFVPDNPQRPLALNDSAFADLWPLGMGRRVDLEVARGDQRWLWSLEVVDTATVTVPAGTFFTYRVDGVENTIVTRDPSNAVTNLTSWWYAPDVAAVVRVKFLQAKGPRKGANSRNELLRIERP